MKDKQEQKSTGFLGLTVSACSGMFVFGIVMAILGAILPSLFNKIQFDKAEAGNLFFAMNLAMLVASLVFGPVVDRFGFKMFLVFCSLFVGVSFFMFAWSASYSLLIFAAVVLGFGGGGLNGGTNALTSDIRPEKRSSALNLLGIFFGFGALTIPFLIGILLFRLGLKNILLCAVGLSLVPFFLFLFLKFPRPKHEQGFPIAQAAKIVKHPLLWLCGFLLFFQSGNEFTLGGWVSTYLQEHFRMTPMTASFVLAGYWGAIMAGRLASTKLVRVTKNERLVLFSSFFALASALLLFLAPSKDFAAIGAVLIGLGFAAIFPTTLAMVGEIFPAFTGTAFSFVFVVALAGGMTSPWLTGQVAQAYSIKQGFLIPVVNCTMIVLLQIVIIKLLRRSERTRKDRAAVSFSSKRVP